VKLALYTFGVFARSAEHPENDSFHFLNDLVLPQVDRAVGLIGRSGYDSEPSTKTWGRQVFPKFYNELGDGWSPSTLSLWIDLESAMAFSYFGLHATALKRGREWFVKPDWPPYVVWWAKENEVPDWTEAVRRHQYLHDNGPTEHAFTFTNSFDPEGVKLAVDQVKMKAIANLNSESLPHK
jgi:Domain of unknown function (DUF3291)